MKNSEIKKIAKVLNFIEKDQGINLQLSLINQPEKTESGKRFQEVLKISYSKNHNTNSLICKDFYKKTF